jgi:hypothetical protein
VHQPPTMFTLPKITAKYAKSPVTKTWIGKEERSPSFLRIPGTPFVFCKCEQIHLQSSVPNAVKSNLLQQTYQHFL